MVIVLMEEKVDRFQLKLAKTAVAGPLCDDLFLLPQRVGLPHQIHTTSPSALWPHACPSYRTDRELPEGRDAFVNSTSPIQSRHSINVYGFELICKGINNLSQE